jgi:hypothetical protein
LDDGLDRDTQGCHRVELSTARPLGAHSRGSEHPRLDVVYGIWRFRVSRVGAAPTER